MNVHKTQAETNLVPTFLRVKLLYNFNVTVPSPLGGCHAGCILLDFPVTQVCFILWYGQRNMTRKLDA